MSFWQGMGWGIAFGVVLVIGGIAAALWLTLRRHGLGRRDGDLAEVAKELELEAEG